MDGLNIAEIALQTWPQTEYPTAPITQRDRSMCFGVGWFFLLNAASGRQYLYE